MLFNDMVKGLNQSTKKSDNDMYDTYTSTRALRESNDTRVLTSKWYKMSVGDGIDPIVPKMYGYKVHKVHPYVIITMNYQNNPVNDRYKYYVVNLNTGEGEQVKSVIDGYKVINAFTKQVDTQPTKSTK